MKKFTFIGCSITKGEGLPDSEFDSANYPNIIGQVFNAEVTNLSRLGNTNYNIFIDGLNQLLFNRPDVLVIQWSGLQRHWLYPNLDITLTLTNRDIIREIDYLDTVFSKKELQKFCDQFLLLNHDYHNILHLLNYCKILEALAREQTQLIFVNGLIPWTQEIQYLETLDNTAKYFSEYTKKLLSHTLLPDSDIEIFFKKIFYALNEIDKNKWINIFSSMLEFSIDAGLDKKHPGPKTHNKIAQLIINKLTNDQRL